MIGSFIVAAIVACLLYAVLGMADPQSAITNDPQYNSTKGKAKIVSAEPLVQGGFVAQLFGNGELQFIADEPGAWPCGYITGPEFGTSLTGTALDTEADVGGVFQGDVILRKVAVTGVAAYADIGEPVYATDGQTLTKTRPSDDAVAFGFVWDKVRDDTTTTCDVYVFGKFTSWLLAAAGGNRRTVAMVRVGPTYTAGYLVGSSTTGITLHGHGRIIGFKGFVIDAPTNDTKETAITLKINDTAVTGALVDFDADENQTVGAQVAGSSANATAANEFHDGDLLQIVATGGSPPTDADLLLVVDAVFLPGA